MGGRATKTPGFSLQLVLSQKTWRSQPDGKPPDMLTWMVSLKNMGSVEDDPDTDEFYALDFFESAMSDLASRLCSQFCVPDLRDIDPALRHINVERELRQYFYEYRNPSKNALGVKAARWPALQTDRVSSSDEAGQNLGRNGIDFCQSFQKGNLFDSLRFIYKTNNPMQPLGESLRPCKPEWKNLGEWRQAVAVASGKPGDPLYAQVVRFMATWFDGVRHQLALVRWLTPCGHDAATDTTILRTSDSPNTVDFIPVNTIIRPIALVPVEKWNEDRPGIPTYYYLNQTQTKDLLMYMRKLERLRQRK